MELVVTSFVAAQESFLHNKKGHDMYVIGAQEAKYSIKGPSRSPALRRSMHVSRHVSMFPGTLTRFMSSKEPGLVAQTRGGYSPHGKREERRGKRKETRAPPPCVRHGAPSCQAHAALPGRIAPAVLGGLFGCRSGAVTLRGDADGADAWVGQATATPAIG